LPWSALTNIIHTSKHHHFIYRLFQSYFFSSIGDDVGNFIDVP